MATKLIKVKLEHDLLKDINTTSKNAGFQNRTEFIHAVLREKIEKIKLKRALMLLSEMRGKAPRKTTDEELEKIREKVFEEFNKKLG